MSAKCSYSCYACVTRLRVQCAHVTAYPYVTLSLMHVTAHPEAASFLEDCYRVMPLFAGIVADEQRDNSCEERLIRISKFGPMRPINR